VWLPTPDPGPDAAQAWVDEHLGGLTDTPAQASSLRGGQTEADRRLASLDITGYAASRNEVLPTGARGATQLSPWIRHGLLQLPEVWAHVGDTPSRDRQKYRDELLWQEYARHWYARLGSRTNRGIRSEIDGADRGSWPEGMECVNTVLDELHRDGWLVNQTRMWLASQWTIRDGNRWSDGEDYFFRHLLDGSRAANRLGWQWTTGVGSSKPYGFSRWQVNKRAPELCVSCARRESCPIEDWPEDRATTAVDRPMSVRRSNDPTADHGPLRVMPHGTPSLVWLTAESLGDQDPALASNPELPAVFVFDRALLTELRLASKRLVFLTECLSDLATRREVRVALGDPVEVLGGEDVAATFTPVPGWDRRAAAIGPVEVHPWPWLRTPTGGNLQSFSAWRKSL
jgi:deoxyribodipyrimidine photo-lyase